MDPLNTGLGLIPPDPAPQPPSPPPPPPAPEPTALEQMANRARQQLEAVEEKLNAAAALLASLEWSGGEVQTPTHRREPSCPSCGAAKSLGHAEGCALAPWLPKAES